MKKIISIIALTIALISNLNIYAYDDSQIDIIKNAIKISRPKLLKQALNNIKLTDKDKEVLLSLAISIAQNREKEININLIVPKEDIVIPDGTIYHLIKFIPLISNIPVLFFILNSFFTKVFDWDQGLEKPTAIAYLAATIWAYKKLDSIGKEKNTEFYQNYRTEKQKYIDSLDVIAILKLN
ncbi:hypothetical protein [Candidatus Babela massiliensis]|uniref:Uncharacterized protein n=1 Tax=Candidatus Babela massiliensis TaxID=673862 RepID=V6DHF0_9BACT|nr:hypothetical protein [Candidatus Babela massiliensis]CDK30969.1 hypothetical protein BABL1_gene_103 [Candidatus Babela massiliensis]